ncbi:hypothetical protein SISNIDRAFT_488695 [Sistotremastrum niveocremeum HHB9708]|uniref:Uncharacterized protein n=1 Tax=Sistotremastrum niveocremeum HHB9708 TaxID=1314777 RepID=A0A164R1I5_9AGAM|nr:hypothetical protein SISNIDRAFT_488695 [Sistotremastrum niveocremeum HHB9708]
MSQEPPPVVAVPTESSTQPGRSISQMPGPVDTNRPPVVAELQEKLHDIDSELQLREQRLKQLVKIKQKEYKEYADIERSHSQRWKAKLMPGGVETLRERKAKEEEEYLEASRAEARERDTVASLEDTRHRILSLLEQLEKNPEVDLSSQFSTLGIVSETMQTRTPLTPPGPTIAAGRFKPQTTTSPTLPDKPLEQTPPSSYPKPTTPSLASRLSFKSKKAPPADMEHVVAPFVLPPAPTLETSPGQGTPSEKSAPPPIPSKPPAPQSQPTLRLHQPIDNSPPTSAPLASSPTIAPLQIVKKSGSIARQPSFTPRTPENKNPLFDDAETPPPTPSTSSSATGDDFFEDVVDPLSTPDHEHSHLHDDGFGSLYSPPLVTKRGSPGPVINSFESQYESRPPLFPKTTAAAHGVPAMPAMPSSPPPPRSPRRDAKTPPGFYATNPDSQPVSASTLSPRQSTAQAPWGSGSSYPSPPLSLRPDPRNHTISYHEPPHAPAGLLPGCGPSPPNSSNFPLYPPSGISTYPGGPAYSPPPVSHTSPPYLQAPQHHDTYPNPYPGSSDLDYQSSYAPPSGGMAMPMPSIGGGGGGGFGGFGNGYHHDSSPYGDLDSGPPLMPVPTIPGASNSSPSTWSYQSLPPYSSGQAQPPSAGAARDTSPLAHSPSSRSRRSASPMVPPRPPLPS